MISEEIKRFHRELPKGVELVAVSKFHPSEAIMEAYEAGQRIFGESRVQEFLAKQPMLPSDIQWHFIGHLQTNKVKMLIGKTSMIESVDSFRLLNLIDNESRKAGVITNCLLQVHVAQEETKFGFSPEELFDYFAQRGHESLTNTRICGIMGMASNTDDEERVRADFRQIASTFRQIRDGVSSGLPGFEVVSMGMSGDYAIAVEEGSTHIRIGTTIFGNRQY